MSKEDKSQSLPPLWKLKPVLEQILSDRKFLPSFSPNERAQEAEELARLIVSSHETQSALGSVRRELPLAEVKPATTIIRVNPQSVEQGKQETAIPKSLSVVDHIRQEQETIAQQERQKEKEAEIGEKRWREREEAEREQEERVTNDYQAIDKRVGISETLEVIKSALGVGKIFKILPWVTGWKVSYGEKAFYKFNWDDNDAWSNYNRRLMGRGRSIGISVDRRNSGYVLVTSGPACIREDPTYKENPPYLQKVDNNNGVNIPLSLEDTDFKLKFQDALICAYNKSEWEAADPLPNPLESNF